MDKAEIYCALGELFESVFGRPIPLRPDLTAADVADWDSFKQIEILIGSEQRFGFKLTVYEIEGVGTVGELVDIIASRTS